jgi:DNA repair protein RecO
MQVETPAFVLRSFPFSEADRIVVLFSREEGKLRGVAPRAATSRKRFGGTLSVLAEVELRYREREGRDLGRLEWCRLVAPTPGEGRDLEAFYAACYLAEILEQVGRERQADPRLYRLTGAVARALAAGIEPYLAARYFEVWALRLAGLFPELKSCAGCGVDLAETGAVLTPGEEAVCRRCASVAAPERRLTSGGVMVVRSILTRAPDGLEMEPLPVADLAGVARVAESHFRQWTERPFRTATSVVLRRQRRSRRQAVGGGGQ